MIFYLAILCTRSAPLVRNPQAQTHVLREWLFLTDPGLLSKDKVLNKKAAQAASPSASTEIRTPVLTLKGLRPGPLDDGGIFFKRADCIIHLRGRQAFFAD